MTAVQNWLTPELTREAAFTILHFLWQGVALAALASAAMALFRNAATRYAIAVAFLALMVAAPLVTFLILRRQLQAIEQSDAAVTFQSATAQVNNTAISLVAKNARRTHAP